MVARFEYWWLSIRLNSDTKEWEMSFSDGTPSVYGWDNILAYIAAGGWEIISILPDRWDTWHPSEQGYEYVTRYRVFCKRPI